MRQKPTIFHYDNDDNQKGVLHGVSSCYADWEVNGDRTLNAHTTSAVTKEDRLVLVDKTGKWREYIVADTPDDDTGTGADLICLDALEELSGKFIEDRRPTGTPAELLEAAIEDTRWESAGCDIEAEPVQQVWYHTNPRKVIDRIAATFGGEVFSEYVVEGSKVTHRRVGIRKRLGSDKGKRYSYGHNILGISREWGTERIYTRVWGYGSGVEATDDEGNTTGGYTRRINFGEVNGGKRYVESDEARKRWGRSDGKGGKEHVETDVVFEDCKDPVELLRLTTEWAEAQYEPHPSYEINPYFLEEDPPEQGDDVTIIDKMFNPPLRTKARVSKGHEDYCQPENDAYTIGKVPPIVVDTLAEQDDQQRDLSDRTAGLEGNSTKWDEAYDNTEHMPGQWLQQMMSRLNSEFDQGGAYKFESFKLGTIYSSVPLDENGRPTKQPATALQLTGLGFRIASKCDESGNFIWTTFGTGDGFTASVINVGLLTAGDNYIDLDHGEVRLSASSTKVGEQTLPQYVDGKAEDIAEDAIKDAMTQQKVFDALTNGGQNQGIYLSGGQVYLNASYIQSGTVSANLVKAGVLADQAGNVAINLNTGKATLKDIEASGSFTCGTAQNGMRLTSDGKLAGYRNGSEVGYINYMGSIQDELGRAHNGLLISGGAIGFDVDAIYVRSGSTNYRMTSGTAQYQVVRNVILNGDGTLSLATGSIMVGFQRGLCSYFDVW